MRIRVPLVVGVSCCVLAGGVAVSQAGFAAQGQEPAQASQLASAQVVRGSISGVVSGVGKRPVVGYTVEAFTPDGNFVADAVTDASGRYTLEALPAGSYRVRISGPDAGAAPWAMSWVGGSPTMVRARVLEVSATPLRADATLATAATLTGRVAGVPADSEVRVCGPAFLDCLVTKTGTDGSFTLRGLAAGRSSIVVRKPDGLDLAFPKQPPRAGVLLRANEVTNIDLDATTQAEPTVSIRGSVVRQNPLPPRLDRSAPRVMAAKITLARDKRYVQVSAADGQGGSGLANVQVRVGTRELPPTRYTTEPISAPGTESVSVRVQDKSGNFSAWVVAE